MKTIMAMALARKLLVALWHYAETGAITEGARLAAAWAERGGQTQGLQRTRREVKRL